jgi:hypothetical protein
MTLAGVTGVDAGARCQRFGSEPVGILPLQAQDQRGAGFGVRFAGKQKQNGRSIFHRAAESKPSVERHMANQFGGNIAEVDRDAAEASALQQQIGDAKRLIDILAADPKQIFQIDAGGSGRAGIERIGTINEGAGFFLRSSGAERGEKKSGEAGGGRTKNFGEGSARKASSERIDFLDAGGNRGENAAVAIGERRGDAAHQGLFDLSTQCGKVSGHDGGRGKRLMAIFAFCSPWQFSTTRWTLSIATKKKRFKSKSSVSGPKAIPRLQCLLTNYETT